MTTDGAATLVLDENVLGVAVGLRKRGLDVVTVKECGGESIRDPDVLQAVANKVPQPWVLVTMDLTIVSEYQWFPWGQYAVAWIRPDPHALGARQEESKHDVIHHWARKITRLRQGDHNSYRPYTIRRSSPNAGFRDRH